MRILVLFLSVLLIGSGCHRKQPPAQEKAPKAAAAAESKSKPSKGPAKTKNETKTKSETKAKSAAKAKPVAKPKEKSGLTVVIEDVTGKTTIDAGRRAEAKIKAAADKHNKDLNEILGE